MTLSRLDLQGQEMHTGTDSSLSFRKICLLLFSALALVLLNGVHRCRTGRPTIARHFPLGRGAQGPMHWAPSCSWYQGVVKEPVDKSTFSSDRWIAFPSVGGLLINDDGTFDGQGQEAWPYNDCAKNPDSSHSITSTLWIHKTSSINSKKNSHFLIFRRDTLEFRCVRIIAPEDSPNTDGIHIGDSSHIKIADSVISTGDKCVSIGPGSRDVEAVGTQNRARIKSWASPLKSNAHDIPFYDITMKDRQSPIIIDQWYCPIGGCSKQPGSNVQIKDVRLTRIGGTSASQVAINLVCSPNVHCENIVLDNIDLAYPGSAGPT